MRTALLHSSTKTSTTRRPRRASTLLRTTAMAALASSTAGMAVSMTSSSSSSSSKAAAMAAAPLLRLPPKLTTPTTVLWFRNNLRLDDNPALVAACRDATARGDALLPIVCLDAATGSDDDSTSTSTSSKVANNVNSPHHRRAPAAATLGASAPRTPYGSLKVGPYRAQFLLEAVDDLQQSWAAKYGGSSSSSSSSKSELVVLSGSAPDVIAALGPMVTTVHAPQETCYEETKCERDVATILKRHRSSSSGSSGSSGSGPGNGLVLHWEATLYHLDDLPTGSCDPDSMQLSFTPWKNKVEKQADLRPCVKAPASLPPLPSELLSSSASSSSSSSSSPLSRTPTLSELGYASSEAPGGLQDGRCALRFQGGESAAKERLQGWMFDRDCLKEYFEVRNGMLGADYSTKLAPWLALGCVSARRVASEVSRYESERMANTPRDERYNGRPNGNKSTYWVLFELLWRDFFRFASVKMGDDLFKIQGPVPRNFDGSGGGGGGGGKQHPKGASFAESAAKRWWRDPLTDPEAAAALKAWKEGRTGAPLVDANMRELAETGFMSNRGRQNVASFLVNDLMVDWRAGADHFESLLLDYDPCSNWGNWVAAAGLTGGRVNRFNIGKQAKDYDAGGDYVRHWLPELSEVPAPMVHEPWKLSQAQRAQYSGGSDAAKQGLLGGYPLTPIPRPGQSWGTREGGGGGKGGGGGNDRKRGAGGGGSGSNKNRGGGNSRAARDKHAEQQQGKQQRRRAARVQHGYMTANDDF